LLTTQLSTHPCSTIFPYTTLFRSAYRHFYDHPNYNAVFFLVADSAENLETNLAGLAANLDLDLKDEQDRSKVILAVKNWFERNEDRKSTRLNSSHLGISYAVFCLK